MDQALLRSISERYLLPFFSGAYIEDQAVKSNTRDGLVSFRDPQSIYFKAERSDDYKLAIFRSQPFATDSIIPEKDVIQSFIDVIGSMNHLLSGPLQRDLLSTFQRRVVALALGGTKDSTLVLSAIDQLASWGGRLYEGAPISAAIGLRNKPQGAAGSDLTDMAKHDFVAVLSNGHDTLLEFDFAGRFIDHQALVAELGNTPFCPLRQIPIAEWTTANERRIALTLNRLGEILVFKSHQLLFCRRSGNWHFLTHDPVLKQMATPRDPQIRRAIYESCLDASFARTGACIGVVGSGDSNDLSKTVSKDDWLSLGRTTKSETLAKMIDGKKFHEIDRRLRQELVAIDGATVLSHTGDVLAVGAIVQVPSGSTGGGRLAAAKRLAKLGLGIKVSQDGGITGFKRNSEKPDFRVM